MRQNRQLYAALAAMALLASCGGEDGTGQDPVVVAPTPVPTPSPTPSPSPTPTPTPTLTPATYETAFNFTRDREFVGIQSASIRGRLDVANGTVSSSDSNKVTYNAGTRTLVIDGVKGIRTNGTFPVSSAYSLMGTALSYSDYPFYLEQVVKPNGIEYLVYSHLQEQASAMNYSQFAVFGSPTLAPELASLTSKSYSVRTTPNTQADASTLIVVDPVTGVVSGKFQYSSSYISAPLLLTITGTVSKSTGNVTGTLTTADGGYTGTFVGRLYGPSAVELGIAVLIEDKRTVVVRSYVGVVVGRL